VTPENVRSVLNSFEQFAGAVRVDADEASLLGPYLFADLVDLAYDEGFTERLEGKLRDEWAYFDGGSPAVLAQQFHRMLVAALVSLAEEAAGHCPENAIMPPT
jgi:ferredoxin